MYAYELRAERYSLPESLIDSINDVPTVRHTGRGHVYKSLERHNVEGQKSCLRGTIIQSRVQFVGDR